MADTSFRSARNSGQFARDDDRARHAPSDPLAELARLIGQADPHDEFGRAQSHGSAEARYETAQPAEDWDAGTAYIEQHPQADARYAPPPADAYRHDEPPAPSYPAAVAAVDAAIRGDMHAPVSDRRYRDDPAPATARGPASFTPSPSYAGSHELNDQPHDEADDQYDAQDYDDIPQSPWRRRSVIAAALVGLVVLGTAGAFAYRTMFGGSVLPSLPPIIKASSSPIKVVPNPSASQGSASDQADASQGGSTEKLVSHDEQPVDVNQAANPAPRVVDTIPIFPDPNAPGSGNPSPDVPVAAPSSAAPLAGAPNAAPAMPTQSGALPEPKKVHTVIIRTDQPGQNAAAAAAMSPAEQDAAPPAPAAAASTRTASLRPPKPRAAPEGGGNAPLALVPQQGGEEVATAPPQARTRPVRTETASAMPIAPSEAARPAAGGGYAVQVSSQRSEAEAQAAYRELQAKFPSQLGGHQPMIRQVDLGAKGVYFRALVGPFASAEQAAGMCSKLKAAGGSCLVQRN